MRVFGVLSRMLPGTDGGRPAQGAENVTRGTYNPQGGKRVQLAWLRYSTSQRRAARLYARPARLSDPARPVRPVACR